MARPWPRLLTAAIVAVVLLCWCPTVRASPVIKSGREPEIISLIEPFTGRKDLGNGHHIESIEVRPQYIELSIEGKGERAALKLLHPGDAPPGAERTPSFWVIREGSRSRELDVALDEVVGTIRRNDDGDFWLAQAADIDRASQPSAPGRASRAMPGAGQPRQARYRRDAAGQLVRRALTDGIAWFVIAVAAIFWHLRHVFAGGSRRHPLTLAGIVGVGAALRWLISPEATMNVWAYVRIVPMAKAAWEGVLLPEMARWFGISIYLTDLNFDVTFAIAIVTPLVFFAHARYVLADKVSALVAAGLFAFLPMAIRFARSDTEFVQSLATSSLAFVALYGALTEPARLHRTAGFVALPVLTLLTYLVRPENMFFYAVDLGAIWLTAGRTAPLGRRILASAEITTAAAVAAVVKLIPHYATNVTEGLSPQTLRNAVAILGDSKLNTLLNASFTPPGLLILAALGGYQLLRSGETRKLLFLVLWLVGFFIVHSYVRPSVPEMQARYHLHLITPFLLLAAASTPLLRRAPRWIPALTAAYVATCPLVHLRFERDTAFNEIQEFDFLRSVRRQIPVECTIIELSPAASTVDPKRLIRSRLERIGLHLDQQGQPVTWPIVNMGTFSPELGRERLSEQAGAIVAHGPACLMVYEGLTCRSHSDRNGRIATVCEDLRERLDLKAVATTTIRSRMYDHAIAGRLRPGPDGQVACHPTLVEGEAIELTLYRAASKSNAASTPARRSSPRR